MARDGEEDAIAVDDFAGLRDEERAVGIAVEGHTELSALGDDALLQTLEIKRAAAGIDVAPIGRNTHGDDFSAERAEKLRPELIGGAIGAVENHAEAGEIGAGKSAAAQEIEIFGVQRCVGSGERGIWGGRAGAMLKNVGFELFFDGIGELHARVREKLDAIVLVRIVRGGDDHTGLKIILADEAGDPGSGNDSRKSNRCAGMLQPRSEESGDVRAGFASIHADQGVGSGVFAEQISSERTAGGKKRGVIERRSAGKTADAVGSEELFGHERLTFNS